MRSGNRSFLSILIAFFLFWLSFRFLMPLFSPFVLGTLLALLSEPMVSCLNRKLRVPRGISTGIGVGISFTILAMLLLSLCAFLVRELGSLTRVLPDLEHTAKNGFSLVRSWLLQLSSHTPKSLQPVLEHNVNRFFSDGTALLDRATGYLLGLAGNLLTHVPDSALGLGTAVVSAFLISAKLPKIRLWLLRRIPRERLRMLVLSCRRMKAVLLGWLTAQCKLVGVGFLILFLGFVILRIPHALIWALGICLVDIFPVLGTGTVLIPWSLICLLQGDSPRAIGLAAIYIAVALTRSMLEPKFLGRHLGLDPLATLIALYVGFRLWGVGGIIAAPILTVAALQLTAIRHTED